MNQIIPLRPLLELFLLVIFAAGCNTQTSTTNEAATPSLIPPVPSLTNTIEPTTAPPEHRIGVRVVNGIGEFYDRISGEEFIPRGNNYIRLAPQQGFSDEIFTYHSTFNLGLYDPETAEKALQRMHEDGYNIVRVFIQGNCKTNCIGDFQTKLSRAYIANLVDFLQKAKQNEIFVIITIDSEPATPYYISLLDTTWSENFGGTNSNYLRGGGVLVGKTFWQDFIEELLSQKAALDSIFAYEIRNETFFETNAPPFTLASGMVSTADGNSYNVNSEEERQRMMDENLVYWIDQIRSAILERDPSALVAVGFFPPDSPNPWPSAPRFIRTNPAVWQSSIDFLDFHPYPGGYSLDKLVENLGMVGFEEKPIIMGEFGASTSSYSSASQAAQALHDWQVESCKYGFDGWLLWTWDSVEQTDFYNGLSDEGQISQALSPRNRLDPCQPGDITFFHDNSALEKPVRASKSLVENPATALVDGATTSWWTAGDFAPQWIEIDLLEPITISEINMLTSQDPAGETIHRVSVKGANLGDTYQEVQNLSGQTQDSQWLTMTFANPLEAIRYVKVETLSSPSWVAWREIQVIAGE